MKQARSAVLIKQAAIMQHSYCCNNHVLEYFRTEVMEWVTSPPRSSLAERKQQECGTDVLLVETEEASRISRTLELLGAGRQVSDAGWNAKIKDYGSGIEGASCCWEADALTGSQPELLSIGKK
jgi:hypothetical protein